MNAKWLLVQYLSNIKAAFLDMWPDPLLQPNERFHNLHRGERCFILGSGNSIKEQDLTKLSGEIVMTQNHFHAHEQIRVINPAYHVVVPKYQPKDYDNDWAAWLKSMDERLPQDTKFFFGKNTKYLLDQLGLFSARAFYIRTGGSVSLVRRMPVDITRRLQSVPTVLTECLAIAIYMGFSEVVLVGFDLDQMCRRDRATMRFYGYSPVTANKAEIAIENEAYAVGAEWIEMWGIWRQCIGLRQEAERHGVRIINATRGGLLNMFERQTYEEIV